MRYKFVDRIIDFTNNSITGIKCVSLNEDIFNDHFVNYPILPAAMMTEVAAELSRYFVWQKSNFKLTSLVNIFKKFKFYEVVMPGAKLIVKNQIVKYQDFTVGSCIDINTIGTVDDKKVFDGNFTIKLFELEKIHNAELAKSEIQVLKTSEAN